MSCFYRILLIQCVVLLMYGTVRMDTLSRKSTECTDNKTPRKNRLKKKPNIYRLPLLWLTDVHLVNSFEHFSPKTASRGEAKTSGYINDNGIIHNGNYARPRLNSLDNNLNNYDTGRESLRNILLVYYKVCHGRSQHY